MSIKSREASRKLAKAIRKAGVKPTAVAYVTSVSKDQQGSVTGAVATVQGLSNVKIGVPYGSPIGKRSRILVENHGSAVSPDWRAASLQGGAMPVPHYISDRGGIPIITPGGAISSAPNLFTNPGFDLKHKNIPIGWRSSEQARVIGTMGED